VIASWLPLYHDMGLVACFLTPFYLGVPIISLDAFEWTANPPLLLEAIEQARATHVWLPNFAFAHIARTTPPGRTYDLSSLVAAIGCSEPNRVATFDRFQRRFAAEGLRPGSLQACYAMAETVFGISQTRLGAPPRRLRVAVSGPDVRPSDEAGALELISNGRPIPGVELAIFHDGALHGEDVAGEICVRCPFLFDGYFADPNATEAAFAHGFFKTGDLGFVHDGEVYVFGRSKDLVIVNGRNFYAHDLEAVVNETEGVKQGRCVAFSVYHAQLGSERIVVVAERAGEEALDDHVAIQVNKALVRHFGIAAGDVSIVAPGWLIKTTSGKISRSENAAKYAGASLSLARSPAQ
jgi:acyl-CoA synthetase (AMP-forming)/AMP-acid ligase II